MESLSILKRLENRIHDLKSLEKEKIENNY
jgi:hypothetical protein